VLAWLACAAWLACGPTERWAGPPYVAPPPDAGAAVHELAVGWRQGEIDGSQLLQRVGALDLDPGPFELSGPLVGHHLLSATPQPHFALADVHVPEGSTLLLMPGAVLELSEAAQLRVDGELYVIGTESLPATITGRRGAPFATVRLGGTGPHRLHGCRLTHGVDLVSIDGSGDSDTRIEHCSLDDWRHLALFFKNADGLRIAHNSIGMQTARADMKGETINGSASRAVIEANRFGRRRGRPDVVELKKCGDHLPVIQGNLFEGGEDDAIDLDDCSAIVTGNWIRNFRPSPSGRGAENGGGITGDGSSAPLIANNVIENCLHGIGFKDGTQPLIAHNTILDCDVGLTLYTSDEGKDRPHAVVYNNLFWGNRNPDTGAIQDVVLNGRWWRSYNHADDVQATFDAYGNLGGRVPFPASAGNQSLDPRLQREQGLPQPAPGSPAIGAGVPTLPAHPGFTEAQLAEVLASDFLGRPRSFGSEGSRITPGALEPGEVPEN